LLEGTIVNLKVLEKEDIDFMVECFNDVDFWGEYSPIGEQVSKSEWIKLLDNPSNFMLLTELKILIIQKKNGEKIGITWHIFNQPYKLMEIVCFLVPNERAKGYGTEVAKLMIDYLFLSKDIVRIQAIVNVSNKASQCVFEKSCFRMEGTIRKTLFVRGVWADYHLVSILREEWKEPKILTRTA